MKRMFLVLGALVCCSVSVASSPENNSGLFVSFGAGLSPIYIEEIIEQNELSLGASAFALNSLLRTGWQLNADWAIVLQADYNWYRDAQSNTYATGLLNPGLQYQFKNLFNSYAFAGYGLADMRVFGDSQTSAGTGLNLGYGFTLGKHLTTEVSFNRLQFAEVAAHYGTGDTQVVNAVNLRLRYRWN